MPELFVKRRRVSYAAMGAGEPVILLHGGGSNGRQWKTLVSLIADGCVCCMPDLYGHGASPQWDGEDEPSLEDFAAIVEAIAGMAGRPFHLVGHSHGGAVAITYAVRNVDALSSLTLIEPTLMHLLRIAGSAAAWQEAHELGFKHIDAVARGEAAEIADEFLLYWIGGDAWQAMPEEQRAAVIATMPAVAHFWTSEFAETTPAEVYARLDVPTLLIRGTETRATTREIVALLHGLLPDSRILEIDGAGHMVPLTHAPEVNGAIKHHIAHHCKTKDSG
jgi:pimeloyl-ACP methyl ester carboxylesterase